MERSPETGIVTVEKVAGKSTVTRSFSKYPLKLIFPNKVGSSKSVAGAGAVWIYTLSYGGGIVSGDRISLTMSIGDGCTAALTTQASTKVYKSVDSKCSHQVLEARVGKDSLLVVIPDPVTCFATARYIQKQVFRVHPDSNLLIVDWITSGRYESGERWEFDMYKSTNHILLEEDEPLFLDSVLLEERSIISIAERMQEYQVIATVIILGYDYLFRGRSSPEIRRNSLFVYIEEKPKLYDSLHDLSILKVRATNVQELFLSRLKLKDVMKQFEEEVKQMMSRHFCTPGSNRNWHNKSSSQIDPTRAPLIASCSAFGPQALGMVVRISAVNTELVYKFLGNRLSALEPFLGASPYWQSGQ